MTIVINTFPRCNCDLIKIAELLDSCSDRSRVPICVFIAADDDRVLNSENHNHRCFTREK